MTKITSKTQEGIAVPSNQEKFNANPLEELQLYAFGFSGIDGLNQDLDTLYNEFMTSDNAEDHFERSSMQVTYFTIKKVLHAIATQKHPRDINSVIVDARFV